MTARVLTDRQVEAMMVFALALGVATLAMQACGCSPAAESRAANAAILASYERELEGCIDQGQDAGSIEVYRACARRVDARMCAEHGARCSDGGTR